MINVSKIISFIVGTESNSLGESWCPHEILWSAGTMPHFRSPRGVRNMNNNITI